MFLWYAKTFLGRWYKWGGDSPQGFDCSGLVLECCQAIGWVNSMTDLSANDMWVRWKDYAVTEPKPGCLVFYMNTMGRATHVEICIRGSDHGQALALGAKGGGSRTLTVEDAIRDRAFIKVRPILGRSSTQAIRFVDFFDFLES